jgi:hypothetical protein
MGVSSNLVTFLGKTVEDYSPDSPVNTDLVYRLRVEYDDDVNVCELLDSFAGDPQAGNVESLIIGRWNSEDEDTADSVVEKLVELKDVFTNLKALFIGDITYEENEISWIEQGDMSPVLDAYPRLEHFQVRGGTDLEFSNLRHDNLTTLIIETGGCPPNVISEVCAAHLPRLNKLEIWLGSENYGFESTVEDLSPILYGNIFPTLTHLGLMDTEIQDEVAMAVANSPVLNQLKVLDLSMGTLSDTGAEALVNAEGIRKLEHLNLRHHYMSADMVGKIEGLGISVDVSDWEDPEDEEDRYVETGE